MKVRKCGFCGKKMGKPPSYAQEKYKRIYGEKNVCKKCRNKQNRVTKMATKIPVEEGSEDEA